METTNQPNYSDKETAVNHGRGYSEAYYYDRNGNLVSDKNDLYYVLNKLANLDKFELKFVINKATELLIEEDIWREK